MEENIHNLVENYIEAHTDEVSPLLLALANETEETTGLLRWSIGKVEGRLLQLLIKVSGAKKAVEIGTFTGFSGLLMAEALPEDGQLVTCEANREYAELAQRFFDKSPHGRKIRLEFGPAVESLAGVPDASVDFVFIDADKPSYSKYFDIALRILVPGGLIFVDNVFWRYKIFKKKVTNENARAIAAFNEKVKQEDRVEKVMLSVRDGVYLIRKK